MKKVISFGEALIDFIPTESGLPLAEVEHFKRAAGGAPANVAVAIAKLGGYSYFAGKVGDESFGHFLESVFKNHGVHTDYLLFTKEAQTALAFVSLREDGERDFLFYRNPSADMLISAEEIERSWFEEAGIFHFGSITLTHPVSEGATLQGVLLAKETGNLISFDPNLRFSLWPSPETARDKIKPLFSSTDVLKVSEDELRFLTETDHEETAVKQLLEIGVSLVVVTRGSAGSNYFTHALSGTVPAPSIKPVDATGAGDSFVGGLLYQLANMDITEANISNLVDNREAVESALRFANACGAITTTGRGAIPSLPTLQQVTAFMG